MSKDPQIAFEHGVYQNRPNRLYRVTTLLDFSDDNPKNDFRFADYFTSKAKATKRIEELQSKGIKAVITSYQAEP